MLSVGSDLALAFGFEASFVADLAVVAFALLGSDFAIAGVAVDLDSLPADALVLVPFPLVPAYAGLDEKPCSMSTETLPILIVIFVFLDDCCSRLSCCLRFRYLRNRRLRSILFCSRLLWSFSFRFTDSSSILLLHLRRHIDQMRWNGQVVLVERSK